MHHQMSDLCTEYVRVDAREAISDAEHCFEVDVAAWVRPLCQ